MVNACISTIVRNDETYLDEWIDYHFNLGFDQIIIYDHKSDIPLVPKWGDKVKVLRTERLNPHVPDILHNYTAQNYPSNWISLLDVDEFIVLFKDSNINDFLQRFKEYAGVGISYCFYGSAGHIKRPSGSVRENYSMRTPYEYPRNLIMKGILQTKYLTNIFNQHAGTTIRPLVNQDFKYWDGRCGMDSTRNLARINHYYTRSFEEWKFKVEMGNKEKWQEPRDIKFIHELDKNCTIKETL
jgi:hypothetical protein